MYCNTSYNTRNQTPSAAAQDCIRNRCRENHWTPSSSDKRRSRMSSHNLHTDEPVDRTCCDNIASEIRPQRSGDPLGKTRRTPRNMYCDKPYNTRNQTSFSVPHECTRNRCRESHWTSNSSDKRRCRAGVLPHTLRTQQQASRIHLGSTSTVARCQRQRCDTVDRSEPRKPREQRCTDDSVRMDEATPPHRNHHTIVSGQLFSRKLYQGTPCCNISYSTSSLRG